MSQVGKRGNLTRRTVVAQAVLGSTVAGVMIPAVVGCGRAAAPAAPEVTAPATVVVYSNWTTGARGEYMKWLKETFEAELPAITMQLEFGTGNDFLTKLYAMISGGTMPDLAMMWGRDSCKFMNKGAFLDLTRYLQAAKWRSDRFLTADPASFEYQSKTYGLPHMYTTPMLAANLALFTKAGLSFPKDNWTWDDFVQTTKTLTKDGQWGYQQSYVGGNPVESYSYWVWANGGELISADRTKSLWDQPETIEGVRFATDLRNKHNVALPESELKALKAAGVDPFIAGKVGIFHGNVGSYGTYLTQARDLDWDALPFPVSPKGKRTVWHSQSGYYAASNTKTPDQTFKTLAFIMSEKAMNQLGATRATMPSLKSAAYDPAGWLKTPPKHVKLSVDVLGDAKPQPWAFPQSVDWYAAVTTELDAVGLGEKTADEACRAAARQGDVALKSS